jgi:hypothetical protein
MKRAILLSMVIAIIIGGCTQEKKSPIEGAWKLVYGKWGSSAFPANLTGTNIKIWTNDYFASAGQMKMDTTITDIYVGEKYTLDGNKYVEDITCHVSKGSVGEKVNILLEIKNDTLIQRWPVDETWKLTENYNTEKYLRLE